MTILQSTSVVEMQQKRLDEQRGLTSASSDEVISDESLAVAQYKFLGFFEGEVEEHDYTPTPNDEELIEGRYLFLGFQ